jgi:two-component system, chemotaxis family, chemotaxis protein CheY
MGYRFLIVDDSATTRAIIKRTIQMAQVPADTILEASNGADALRLLSGTVVDLILADLHMPEMDGVEMARRVLADPATAAIPIVVVSAEPNPLRIQQILASGVRAHLRKPFTPESIRNIITETLGVVHA